MSMIEQDPFTDNYFDQRRYRSWDERQDGCDEEGSSSMMDGMEEDYDIPEL